VMDVSKDIHPDMKGFAERMKKAGKIRFFGFSTHANLPRHLAAAAELGWIDAVMASYNYRLAEGLKGPIEACAKAGVGLTAFKSIGRGPKAEQEAASAPVVQHFLQKGFTPEQARLKAVWENPAIASVCTLMPNLTILSANAAAARDKTQLSEEDKKALAVHARATCDGYCAGCASICQPAVAGAPPIGDVMRSLMYYRGYGDPISAREVFRRIPDQVRRALPSLDYSQAERLCPQKMAIGELMKEAAALLA